MTHCPRCGQPLGNPSASFCVSCGEPLATTAAPGPKAATLVAGSRCALHPDQAAVEICARCGNFVCPSCLVISAGGQPHCVSCESRGEVDHWHVPWERRGELGFFRAYWDTTKAVLLQPQASFRGLAPATGKWWDPLSYAAFSSVVGISGFAALYAMIAVVGGSAGLFSGAKPASDLPFGSVGVAGILIAYVIAMFLLVPLFTVAVVFIWGGVEHLSMRVLGVETRGYEATVRAHCYATASQILGVVPYCGSMVFPFWQIVTRILGYVGVHRTTGGRATAAVLLPLVVCCVGLMVLYGLFFAAMMAAVAAGKT